VTLTPLPSSSIRSESKNPASYAVQLSRPARGKHDGRTGNRELERHLLANAVRRAGDDRDIPRPR